MAARSAWSGLVLVDNTSGKPLSNGKINFWANGTTSDQDTFTAVGLGVANANPLILDADGRVPEAWSNDTDVYAARVLDENDNVILATVQDLSFISPFTLSSADVLSALAANSAAVDIAGSSMVGSAFSAFADALTLTAAGTIDASAGAITLGSVTGNTTFSGTVTHSDDVFISNGKGMVIGGSTQVTVGTVVAELQVLGTAGPDSRALFGRWSANASQPSIDFLKSRDATIGSFTTIVSGDLLGRIDFYGDDGTDYGTKGASILVQTEGTIGSDRIPTKITFQTGTDASPTVLTSVLSLGSDKIATFAGVITVTDTTDASSSTTGAGVFAGGLSAEKKGHFGTGITTDSGGVTITAGDLTLTAGILNLGAVAILTLDTNGEVTLTQTTHRIDTFESAVTDDLNTINGGTSGDIIIVQSVNNGRDIVIKNGTGNIDTASAGDFTCTTNTDRWVGQFNGTNWIELSRSDNS